MDNKHLQELVEEISIEYFQRPFRHQAVFNKRLKTTGGRYILSSHNIECNILSYEKYGLEELIRIIKHELCHYHLHLQKRGYMHKDREFKDCLNQVGASRYNQPLKITTRQSIKYMLLCKSCHQTYHRKKKMNPSRYRCGKCGGQLEINEIK